jgi:hypothetical protein
MAVFWCTKHGFCPQDEAGDKQLSHCLAQNGNRGCPNLVILPDKHPCDSNGNGNGNGNGNNNGNGHSKGGHNMPPIRRRKKKYGSNNNGNGHNGHNSHHKRKRAKWLNGR